MTDTSRIDELREALARVTADIAAAARAAGRDPSEVSLLPVTKYHPLSDVRILGELGVRAVGENRAQDAAAKADALPGMSFDMIGQVQTKKAGKVAAWARRVHSVDSTKLAAALNRGTSRALTEGLRHTSLEVLVQLSADGESHRGGTDEQGAHELAEFITTDCPDLTLVGVMAMGPVGVDPTPLFRQARALSDRFAERYSRQMLLSAGMSGDMAQAIAAGSTIVRVGTALLGPRTLP